MCHAMIKCHVNPKWGKRVVGSTHCVYNQKHARGLLIQITQIPLNVSHIYSSYPENYKPLIYSTGTDGYG